MTTKGAVNISGISESRVAPVAARISENSRGQTLIIAASPVRAARLAGDLSFFVDKKIYVMPQEETLFRYDAKNHDMLVESLRILKALCTGEDCIVIAPALAAVKKLPPRGIYEEKVLRIRPGTELDTAEIKKQLSDMGYERYNIIDAQGQFAVRGDIIDIYTPDGEMPYRIELFGNEVDAIRAFDPDTQRSVRNLDVVEIYPAGRFVNDREIFEKAADKIRREYGRQIKKYDKARETEKKENLEKTLRVITEYIEKVNNVQMLENYLHYFYDDLQYLWEYMTDGSVIVEDPDRIYEAIDLREAERREDFSVLLERGQAVPYDYGIFSGREDFYRIYDRDNVYVLTPFAKKIKGIETFSELHNIISRQPPVFNGRLDMLVTELKSYIRKDYEITIVCSSQERIDNMKEFLSREDLEAKVAVRYGELTSGIDFPESRKVWLSDADIFTGGRRKKRKNKIKSSHTQQIKSFADIKKGDYIVHENHGIGKFMGIKQLTVNGEKKDYLHIKYAGEDMLYVPVEQMDIVQKYTGSDSVTPKINSLSGTEWKKTKAKAKAAVAEMAADLIELTAARQLEKGYAFEPDTPWQQEFEDSFPYVETDDQLRCIAEIKADMEKPVAMERLLCGDVGFGKTEVAARALFKCVADGKQAAVLVPTTILANQHYYTLKDRFEKFPFKVEVLSRFKSDKEQTQIIQKLKSGQVDLIIGTHRLLSKDVVFKDLGLLVIDEEQRFGVRHKAAIKKLRKNVDVLTLSATPIPRTLHMSLTGIRDMSLIEEPPEDRLPVQTYVVEQDDNIMRDVIERELERGGQVYVVFNRVQGIDAVASKILSLVPDARVAVGHGQMNEMQLEKVMLDFIDGGTNVLVATTIIESGLDISNVNTMIVLDADRFGLSQLYQLRGRVGRSDRMAYAYLMYQPGKVLNEVAEKRLRAIKEFTEFGSGFRVAMRDLEIRGAGNILGTAQSGHMVNIGYELYCKFIAEAVKELQGEAVNDSSEETLVEIPVSAYIPDSYIGDETLKLHMYKKIAEVETKENEEDILEELIDRFGDVPQQVVNLIRISEIRKLAADEFISKICTENGRLVFYFGEKNRLRGPVLAALSEKYGMRIFFHGGVKPFMRLTAPKDKWIDEALEFLLNLSEKK